MMYAHINLPSGYIRRGINFDGSELYG